MYGIAIVIPDLELWLFVSGIITRGTVGIYLLCLNVGGYLTDNFAERVVLRLHKVR